MELIELNSKNNYIKYIIVRIIYKVIDSLWIEYYFMD